MRRIESPSQRAEVAHVHAVSALQASIRAYHELIAIRERAREVVSAPIYPFEMATLTGSAIDGDIGAAVELSEWTEEQSFDPIGGPLRFGDRAQDCRNLAKGARYRVDRIMLEELAEELEIEARRVTQSGAPSLAIDR